MAFGGNLRLQTLTHFLIQLLCSIAFIFSLPGAEEVGAEIHRVVCSPSPLGILTSQMFICMNIERDVFLQELGLSIFIHYLLETEFPSLLNLFLYIVAAICHFKSAITFIFLHSDVVCNQH